MIWIDTSIPRHVAQALAVIRTDILYVGDRYPFDRNKDRIWLPDAGIENGLTILRDKRVRTRPGERRAIIENKVGAFIVAQKTNPTKWEYLKLIVGALDEMLVKFEATEKPFIYLIRADGTLNQVAVRPVAPYDRRA